ncbi:MAG: hypothetical protein J3R72DRAFT_475305 [Linnemannia gamsii]|nr:MAG: hypothetical protein J3R72DRAFT_475305 [Linnemannia gamsii]
MGILGFTCITSTPDGSTIYGLDIANSIDEGVGEFKNRNSFVIFKSNSNPPTPEALTWSVYTRVSLEKMTVYSTSRFVCAVNSEGIFTAVFRSSDTINNDPSGFRFDPNGTPVKDSKTTSVAGNNGRGSWTRINVETKFTWAQNDVQQVLEYVNLAPSGPLQLMYAFADSSGVYFSTYNDKTNTLAKLGSKAFDRASFGTVNRLLIAHNRLYVLGSNGDLSGLTLSSLDSGNMTYTTPRDCNKYYSTSLLFASQKTLYLICNFNVCITLNKHGLSVVQ